VRDREGAHVSVRPVRAAYGVAARLRSRARSAATAVRSLHPFLDEYRAAIEQARLELDHLRGALAAIDDVSASVRLEEVDLTLQLIASDMGDRSARWDAREQLAELGRGWSGCRRRAAAWLAGRLAGPFPWW
jgi:hypothetical protein